MPNNEHPHRKSLTIISIVLLLVSIVSFALAILYRHANSGIKQVEGVVEYTVEHSADELLVTLRTTEGDYLVLCPKTITPEENVQYRFTLVGTPFPPFREYQSIAEWRVVGTSSFITSLFGGVTKAKAEMPPNGELEIVVSATFIFCSLLILVAARVS